MPLRELLAWFNIQVDDRQLSRADSGIQRLIGGAKHLGAVFASAFAVQAVQAIGRFAAETIAAADQLKDMAAQVGVSTDALQELRFAAEQGGGSADSLDRALRNLNRRAGEARTAGGEAAQTFRRFGIAIRDANGQAVEGDALFTAVADRIQGASTQGEKLAIAYQLLGREGQSLVPMLAEGSAGLERARQRFRALGGGMSRDFIERAAQAKDAQNEFNVALVGLSSEILVHVLPTLTKLATFAADLVADFRALTERTYFLEAALGVLAATAAVVGVVLFIAFAKIIVPIAALIAAIVLIVDDLIALFSGGKSVIGDFIDSLFGAGTAAKLVDKIKVAAAKVVEIFETVIATSEEWKEGIQALGIALALIAGGALLTILLVLTAIALIAAAIVAAVVLWVLMVGATVKAAKRLWSTLEEMGESFRATLEEIRAFLSDLFGPAIDAAGTFFRALVDFVVSVGELIWTILSGAFETVFTWVSDRISELIDGIVDGVSKVAGFLGIDLASAGGIGDTLSDTARRAAEFGQEGIRAGADLAGRGLTAGASGLRVGAQEVRQVNQTVINLQTNDPGAAAAAVSRGQRSSNQNAARELEGALVQGA
jgi:hypothetical protein